MSCRVSGIVMLAVGEELQVAACVRHAMSRYLQPDLCAAAF